MKRIGYIAAFLPLLMVPCHATGQTSGLDFLNVGPDPRALSLAEAVTALPLGGASLYTNPANLALETSSSLSAAYTLWIADVYNSHMAVNLKRDRQAIAFGLLNSSTDDLEARLTPGPSDGSFSVSYLSLAAGYARTFGNIAVGIAGHYLREEFYLDNASGYAFSAGLSGHWFDGHLKAGVSLLNMGEMNKLADQATDLPSNLRAGAAADLVAFTPPGNDHLPIRVTLYGDYLRPLGDEITREQSGISYTGGGFFNLGLALDVAGAVVIRTGYKIGDTERPVGLGVGLNLESLDFDYAMVPFNTGFGTVHAIGLHYRF